MKYYFSAVLICLVSAAPAFAGVSISTPSNGDHVSSPFSLSASASSCSSQSVSSIGYSLDNSGNTTIVHNTSVDAKVSSPLGTHTLHVKAWGDKGAVCVTDTSFTVSNVTNDPSGNSSVVPSGAISVSSIEALKNWTASHDTGANGKASGKTSLVGSPSHSGSSRGFATSFSKNGAERYSVGFGDNTTATNFFYDAWVYFTSTASHIANLEMDINQTMPNGQTVIFGIQCSGYSRRWEYTENLGTASHPRGHWAASSAPCSPPSWSKYKWHHVQMSYSRTSTGHIIYKYVWFDGVRSTINKTVFGARALGWSSTMSTNFQIDGAGTGSATVYLDGLKISRW